MAKWMDAYITSYRPSPNISTYRAIMNSQGIQEILLERATVIADEYRKNPDVARYRQIDLDRLNGSKNQQFMLLYGDKLREPVSVDVRPGRNRAHALVKAKHIYKREFKDIGRNKRLDKILLQAMNAARISRKR